MKIFYNGQANEKLDTAIEKLLEKFGYEFDSSGYNFLTEERDLQFELIKK